MRAGRLPGRALSLRTRLTALLVLLAAVGLVLLAAITYATQRRFLEQRVTDQARAALPLVGDAVACQLARSTGYGFDARCLRDRRRGRSREREDGPVPGAQLPPGTYGELRLGDGTRLLAEPVVIGAFGEDDEERQPRLPAEVPIGRPITVRGTDDVRYRVIAERAAGPVGGPRGVVVAAVPLNGVREQLTRLLVVEGIVVAAILLVLGALTSRLVARALAPLRQIADDADEIAGGALGLRVPGVDPRTEVGRLGQALSAMLGRIEIAFRERQASEDRLRQFLADASHELRTPLASIRGYAELQRRGMLADQAERDRAAARIEEQATRMGVLVEDLLALARLDEEREPARDLVDLGSIVRDAAADAESLDPERTWTVTVSEELLVVGDEARLRQVLANLLGNAVAHTPPRTPSAVAAVRDGDDAVLHVDDAGSGVPEEARERIFARFQREAGGTARTRGPAGAGLGLAVVRGIVEAHGGSVVASSSPLGGARFTVRLPAAETADD